MNGRRVFWWRDGAGRSGRSDARGVVRLLEQGRRLTVQRIRPRRRRAAARLVLAARGQVGTVEVPHGSNTGPRVRMYQASTSVAGTGWPWCQAFVRWCMDAAGVHASGYRGAYVPHFETWARRRGLWRAGSSRPKVGWAVVFGSSREAQHVGIIIGVNADGTISTIEGNTSPGVAGSQANGGGVYVRRRDRAWIRGYVAIV